MKRIAVFPGSFDPFSIGHENIVQRALTLFDEIIIAIGKNSEKSSMLSIEKREQIISDTFSSDARVSTAIYKGLTADFCKEVRAGFILRGIRNSRDFDFEQPIAQMNKNLESTLETIFLVNEPRFSAINSSIIRDIYRNGGDVTQYLPKGIQLDKI